MTTYWQDPNGALYQAEPGDGTDPLWTSLTLTQYNSALAAAEAAIEAAIAANALIKCLERKAVYDDLKSVHAIEYSEATYRALSGYTPGDC